MSPLHTLRAALLDHHIHTAIYVIFIIFVSELFSKTWIEVSGSGPRDGLSWPVTGRVCCARSQARYANGGCIRRRHPSSLPTISSTLMLAVLAFSWPSPSSTVTGKSAFVNRVAPRWPRSATFWASFCSHYRFFRGCACTYGSVWYVLLRPEFGLYSGGLLSGFSSEIESWLG
ncbi:hypothetical protein DFH11DRAFT_259843 [Phellopilus nigrolimitatus]|nr:hypothetical protein DFH11DRAFT_259843 [Phellopilus nigrolimitatus]